MRELTPVSTPVSRTRTDPGLPDPGLPVSHNGRALAKVFRAKLLDRLNRAGIHLPVGLPARWVVNCRNVGRGLPALKYLSRDLYRGVLSERNLVALDRQRRTVTFRYTESAIGKSVLPTLSLAAFLWRMARHVLPSDFRRVREYGFLHHNAAKTLRLVQLLLHVAIAPPATRQSDRFGCVFAASSRCNASASYRNDFWPIKPLAWSGRNRSTRPAASACRMAHSARRVRPTMDSLIEPD